ncbi:MAG: methyltransferase domain-containing protein [Candidatus Lokiarchaeota archaeon]|nr:methyltransferase domain-containing protein [Candidatus Lokiarchaeota archaeon]
MDSPLNYFKHLNLMVVIIKMNNNSHKHKSSLYFKVMAFFFKIRDFFKNPMKKIEKIDFHKGDYILEYGCGPGSYTVPIAEKIGSTGKVFAADSHPLASEKVQKRADKNGLNNIDTITTDCKVDLENSSIDKVVLIDVLHALENYKSHLQEFYRVLKNDGSLWVDDHHFNERQIKSRILSIDLFQYVRNIDSLYEFQKIS